MKNEALIASNLSYDYGDYRVLDNISLNLFEGETLLLSGSNGSGKTTLLMCLVGLLIPTVGSILVRGYDLYKDEIAVKQRLAFVPDVPRFYQSLTVWEHLKYIGLAHNVHKSFGERAESLLKEFGLFDARNLYPHALSRGMRQKLAIVLALIRPFEVLVMDEPTASLDASSVQNIKKHIIELNSNGVSIIFSTHNPELMNDIARRTVRLDGGKIDLK